MKKIRRVQHNVEHKEHWPVPTFRMKARLATEIGKVLLSDYDNQCPKAPVDSSNTKRQGRHERMFLGAKDFDVIWTDNCVCGNCGEEFKVGTGTSLYDTPSGDLEPGCLYWDDSLPENFYWDNHQGPMLWAVLPTGARWNIDSHAGNCTLKDNRLHRCWVREGEPPSIHVGKKPVPHSCDAGAGSIWANKGSTNEWHGHLHYGEFVQY